MPAQRGLDQRDEQDSRQLLRDTRPLMKRVTDFFSEPINGAISITVAVAGMFILPGLSDIFAIIILCIATFTCTRTTTLPFRAPLHAHILDYNDVPPGSTKPQRSRGIYFFGNEKNNKEELWFNNDDMRTHCLIFGSTGSGKTEALVSIAYNALVQGSGFIYVDGKGDNSLFAKIFSMARSMGREDDVLTVNFMTGARDIVGPQEKRLSNTMNPFAKGSSSMLSNLVVSLMDEGGSGTDADMWKGRAISFVEALMKVLVYARDKHYILLDANTIRNYFSLERVEAMGADKILVRDDQEPVSLEDAPPTILEPIKNYMINLPGYEFQNKGKQSPQVIEQHGFITMQLTRVFTSLADTYGHIIRHNLAEVDFKDVVLNRRILVVLLPALEKSPEELSNLGKVVISSLKAMMAAGLGEDVEGKLHDVIGRKPTNAPTPYLCILDEYGYYAVKGFAVVPAQARSLGFSVIFAGQDLPAFQKASKEEAASIGANTNIKIAMKLEDPTDTWDFFAKTAGESMVSTVSGFQTTAGSMTNTYMDTRNAQIEKRARVDLLDLKEQREGEAHIFFKSRIVRATMFYANPKAVKVMRLNQFLKVEEPTDKQLFDLAKRQENFQEVLKLGNLYANPPVDTHEIDAIAATLHAHEHSNPIERGVSVLLALHEEQDEDFERPSLEEDIDENDMNIFCKRRTQPGMDEYTLVKAPEKFSRALLQQVSTLEQIEYVERLTGRSSQQAASVAHEIIKDMSMATHYPPVLESQPTPSEFVTIMEELEDRLAEKHETS